MVRPFSPEQSDVRASNCVRCRLHAIATYHQYYDVMGGFAETNIIFPSDLTTCQTTSRMVIHGLTPLFWDNCYQYN